MQQTVLEIADSVDATGHLSGRASATPHNPLIARRFIVQHRGGLDRFAASLAGCRRVASDVTRGGGQVGQTVPGRVFCTDEKKPLGRGFYYLLVPRAGIEPAHLSVQDFESSASTNSTTEANQVSL